MIKNRISVRDHMVAQAAGALPFFDAVAALGIEAFELQVDMDLTTPHVRRSDGSPYSLAGDADVAAMQQLLQEKKMHLSAILLMTDFSSDNAAVQIAWATRAVSIASQLGAPAVRVDPLAQNKELPQQKVADNFVTGVKEVLAKTAGVPVDLGIENHGPFGNDPGFLDGVFAAVNDDRLGMTLDTGNFYWWGVSLDELYALLERYASRTRHTHMKSINYPPALANTRRPIGLDYGKYCCGLDEGNIDLRRVVQILQTAGYSRDLCIENESLGKSPLESRMEILKRDVQTLRKAIA